MANQGEEKEVVVLQSRQSAYDYDKRAYNFWGLKIANGVSLRVLGYIAITEIVVILIQLIFKVPTLFGNIIVSVLFKFGLIPYFAAQALKYSKLDGKSPLAFARDYISFFINRKKQYEMFRDVTHIPEHEIYILDWWCSSRHRLRYFYKSNRRARK